MEKHLNNVRATAFEHSMDPSSFARRLGIDQHQSIPLAGFSNQTNQTNPIGRNKRQLADSNPGSRTGSSNQVRKMMSNKGKESTTTTNRGNYIPSARSRSTGPTLSTKGASNRHKSSNRGGRTPYSQPQTESAIDILRKLLEARWDPVTRLLDLGNLAQDKILKAGGIPAPGEKGAPQKTASAIWKLCHEMYPNIRSLSLAENNLSTLRPMSIGSLVATLPDLENISLAGNRLTAFSELNPFSPTVGGGGDQKSGLHHLRELILKGNPIRTNAEKEGANGLQTYLTETCRRFPSLQVLDGEAIDPAFKASLPPIQERITTLPNRPDTTKIGPGPEPPLPLQIKSAFFDNESTSSVISNFCLKYFNALDSDRNSLIDAYATQSTFSLAASTYLPIRAKLSGLTRNSSSMPAQQAPAWHEYINLSRNIARLKGPKLSERISNGPAEIIKTLKLIPNTKHPLSEPDKFVLDGWQMPSMIGSLNENTIYVTIHGEFTELPNLTVRSFDRTFLLGPAGPASAAALKGWPCVILTDQLTIRSYSSPIAWTPEQSTTTTNSLTIEQQNMLTQFIEATKLNLNLALDCLIQNGWEPLRAIKNFEELKIAGGLPSDAFLA
ncbi:hypothetical protein CROQUDRAFT_714639 [Cronartium quercuum f. sp. fusiforme G11]|uniref:NTF2-like protein n=1 Tax=Cronartium quercuum f. sp. fusiforme G11 TaxID=708437 RepID=A0A9P6NQ20_9BASI|nr:hypothetical protein CROQUDRAFT_714639 [Cronartium quercuum f. sp. fusiforme G11]